MALHNDLGTAAEILAIGWLKENEFNVMYHNWRSGRYEIDIIAQKEGKLHIVEVKSRNESPFGFPEDSVNRKKFFHIKRAADAFLQFHPGFTRLQYDILAITFPKEGKPAYFFLEDVFM